MEKIVFSVVSILLANLVSLPSVISQQQSVPVPQLASHHQPSQNIPDSSQILSVPLDSVDTPVTNHYPYQSTSLSPSNYHQTYPGSSYASRDVAPPIFGLTGGAGYEITAYFGPIFWLIVIIFATFGLCVGVSRLLLGTEIFGGIFQRMKEVAPTGKSLDLDNITNMVYQALDTYGKYAAKQVRDGDMESFKG